MLNYDVMEHRSLLGKGPRLTSLMHKILSGLNNEQGKALPTVKLTLVRMFPRVVNPKSH